MTWLESGSTFLSGNSILDLEANSPTPKTFHKRNRWRMDDPFDNRDYCNFHPDIGVALGHESHWCPSKLGPIHIQAVSRVEQPDLNSEALGGIDVRGNADPLLGRSKAGVFPDIGDDLVGPRIDNLKGRSYLKGSPPKWVLLLVIGLVLVRSQDNAITTYHEQFEMLKSAVANKTSDLNAIQQKMRSIYVTVRSREKIWVNAQTTLLAGDQGGSFYRVVASDKRYYVRMKTKFDAKYDRVYDRLMGLSVP
ncbi:hypothetical protein K493DRAFT_351453 [Basidiobolus meristosporus CBS 931.73]|uniref:Uncharacterized protein n=1 Tax=Basidiobolus meristosporus CBS 931.73 TaxID=1314790 RepID=A0A1Y1YCB0_9FUNG|nr:hypothetical protein K493DRAFT_351453 [Basidiobolus meristosporus CBS 931.73]|eukprot:ORX95583.1 hypothetical protein K493DRAFT_351453 [Basidiobolus meristosporus CBS 931.73]